MRITCLKYADSVYQESHIFQGGSKNRLLPIFFCIYLIEKDERKIIIDAGCDVCPGFEFRPYRSIKYLLYDMDICYDDITDVIITHSHYDHIALLYRFKNATLYIQEDEYACERTYIPEEMKSVVFKEEFNFDSEISIKKIGGHSIGSSIVMANNYVFLRR